MKTFQCRGLTSPSRKPTATPVRLERLEERTVLSSWVAAFGGAGNDSYRSPSAKEAVDSSGNAYIAGYFSSQPADFDPKPDTETAGVFNLSSAGSDDAYVAKYAPDGSAYGKLEWARSFGSTGAEQAIDCVFASEEIAPGV